MVRSVGQVALIAAATAGLGLFPEAGDAQEPAPGPLLERRAAATLPAEPGSSLTIPYLVTNPGPEPLALQVQAAAPEGWEIPHFVPELTLGAGEAAVELLPVSIPARATAGHHPVRYVLLDEAGVVVSDSVTVDVAPLHRVTLDSGLLPPFVPDDRPLEFDVRVRNEGNTAASVELTVEARTAAHAAVVPASLELAPGEVATADVAVHPGTSRTVRRIATVRATPEAGDGARVDVAFEVVPTGLDQVDARRSLPTQVTLATGSGGGPGLRAFSGRGHLDRDRSVHLDVEYRVRDRETVYFGQRESVRAVLGVPGFEVRAGDLVWNLSPLTEPGRYGFGAGAEVEAGPFFAGGHVDDGPRPWGGARQVGALAGLRLWEGAALSGQFLERSEPDAASIASVRGTVRPHPRVDADLEVGRGSAAGEAGWAGSIRLRGRLPRTSADLRLVRADDAFPTRDRNTLLNAVSVSFTPGWDLRLRATHNGITRVPLASAQGTFPDRRRRTEAGATFRNRHSAALFDEAWTRNTASWADASRRRGVRLGSGIERDRLRPEAGVEIGSTLGAGEEEWSSYTRPWVGGTVRPTERTTLSAQLSRERGAPSNSEHRAWRLSASAQLHPTSTTAFRFTVRQASVHDPWLPDTRWIDASVEQRVLGDHLVRAGYRSHSRLDPVDLVQDGFLLEYVVPIGVPVPARERTGEIEVRVILEETGLPLEGALVRVGPRSALADAGGRARFQGLEPDLYRVTLDPRTVGPGRGTIPALPHQATVRASETERVEIVVTRLAQLSGVVRGYESTTPTPDPNGPVTLGPGEGLGGVVIEVATPQERRRATTGPDGGFRIPGLTPGEWTVRVIEVEIPPFQTLEQDTLEIHADPGAEARVEFRVVPRPVGPTQDFGSR